MEEKSLLLRVIAGDDHSYAQLIEMYQRGLIRYCYAITHDIDAAEDIAQEAFIKAYDKLNRYDPNYRFSTWLYKIAHNLALKSLRRPLVLPLEEDAVTPYDDQADEKLAVEAREESVREAVSRLPDHYRLAIVLHYWDRKNYDEIAEIMSVPTTTIKNWLYRARQAIKEQCRDLIN